jgi:DNA-binding transcriptional LysR family regulator
MDQLRAMRTFAEVAGRGGFAPAARALGIAPSVVTRLVAELEASLGARLFHRSTRQVVLTPVGQRYLPLVQAILREVDEAAALATHGQHALQGRVRLVAPALFAALQVMPRLGRLRALHPQIVVDLAVGHCVDGANAEHDISLVVCGEGGLDGDFVAHRLARSQVLLCAAPAWLRQHGHPGHPRELERHAMLAPAWPHLPRPLPAWRHAASAVQEVMAAGLLGITDAALCHVGALAALGIGALPSVAVQTDLAQGRLERVLPDWRLPDLAVHACLPSRRHVPAAVRAVLDFLRAEFGAAEGTDPWLAEDPPARLRLAA